MPAVSGVRHCTPVAGDRFFLSVSAASHDCVYTDAMTTPALQIAHRHTTRPASARMPAYRYLLFAVLALLLHAGVWKWAEVPVLKTVPAPLTPREMQVSLKTAPPSASPAAIRPAPAAASQTTTKPVVSAVRRPSHPSLDTPALQSDEPAATPVATLLQELPAAAIAVPDVADNPADTSAAKAATDSASTAPAANVATPLAELSTLPPPSGTMQMKVIRTTPDRNPVYGIGEISWTVQDQQYQMQVSASLDLLLTSLNLYTLRSEGMVGEHGIQPRIMSETRRGRSETATHFDYNSQTVIFSATTKTATLENGAQDRASIFMQLAGLGLAAENQFQAGKQLTVQVAEDREANQFTFVITGQEEITTPLGKLMTWHVIRPPRPGFYNSVLELWFAPAMHWYPVQIRNTETNGAVTTQTATRIHFTTTESK